MEVVPWQMVSCTIYNRALRTSHLTNNRNRAELAEGWYDPVTKEKADRAAAEQKTRHYSPPPREQQHQDASTVQPAEDHDDSEDDYGPSLPTTISRVGPSVPSMQDLQYRNELAEEDETARRQDLRFDRKMDRRLQKERLEELNPRAEPGSRERQLEKKREKAVANRAFREEKSPGAEEERLAEHRAKEDKTMEMLKSLARQRYG